MGGAGTYNIELVNELKDDIEFHVVTLDRKLSDIKENRSKKDILAYFNNKIFIHTIGNARETFLYNGYFQSAVLRELPRLHKRYNFDIMHADHPHMADILYRFINKIPCVTTVHTIFKQQLHGIRTSGINYFMLEPSEKFQLVLAKPLEITEKLYLKTCKKIITVSNYMKNILQDKFNIDNINVVHTGVDTNIFRPMICQHEKDFLEGIEKPIVLYVGRLTAAKGIYYLAHTIKEIIKQNNNVHFAFAGSGKKQLWEYILNYAGIPQDYFTICGYVPYDQLPLLYNRAKIYISASLCENLSATMLEAMGCGVPPVVTSIAGAAEAVTSDYDGIIVPPYDYKAMANAVLKLLGAQNIRQEMGERARCTVIEKFKWADKAHQIKKIYEEIAAK